ncbi:RARE COLD INDUCIBLE GENE 3, PEROXIDASE 3 [Hibiscus trionum]|uniref:Peroxidase n=1 Tax=Hibiscus trionum TaxID=183268 RepID=A0A9W7HCZ7_HIBTR|nr:RARE COLD INDUCIBLE GENE 3, PEROXIDASE 3 [Hibiscus trionum]
MAGTGFLGVIVIAFGLLAFIGSTHAQLQMNFYAKSCPNAEKIISDYVQKHIPNAPSLAASFIRMHFHDCFVRGCDASVLLNSTNGQSPEKNAVPNQTLRGFDFIDRVKSLVEAECPGVVSCADILTLVARDSIVTVGGPFWQVPTGRRDGVISNVTEARNNIPTPFNNFTTLLTLFNNQGLDTNDLVLLSGAHTIGIAHCPAFSRRLYNSTGPGGVDPTLDSEYAANLKANKCRTPNDNTTIVEMDPGSRKTFDLSYYTLLTKRRGLFNSDAALTTDSTSLALINQLLSNPQSFFYAQFAKAMEKMGRINVKTGSQGQIRKQCAFVNS